MIFANIPKNICNIIFIGPPGPPGELPLLPPDILFQRDAPSSRYTRHKRDTDVSKISYRMLGYKYCGY